MDKTLLRKKIQAQRLQIEAHQQNTAAENIAYKTLRISRVRHAQHLAFYLPVRGEADPRLILREALAQHKFCYLPVMHPRKFHVLWFIRYQHGDALYENRYGILEPKIRASQRRAAHRLDVIIMPIVAFDAACHRLGTGSGFYDRTLQFLNQRRHYQKPYLIGIAYDFQRVPSLVRESHDVVPHEIVTERNHYHRSY